MIDELINKMDEDAHTNAVAHGGVDMAFNASKKSVVVFIIKVNIKMIMKKLQIF